VFARRTEWKLEPNRLMLLLQGMREQQREVLDLTESNPTHCGLHYETTEILQALANPAALDYEPEARGLKGARAAISAYYREQHAGVDPEDIVLCVSTSEAYSHIFRLLCNPGDEVLVPAPGYPLFELLADLHDVKLVPYPLIYDHGWQIDFHSLCGALTGASRAIVVVHPNNPTGSYVQDREREQLNQACSQRNLALIADEVFLDYAHSGAPPASFATNRAALTFTLSGLSKISALPQMKVAWLITSGPEHLAREAKARLEVVADTYLSPNAPVQHAIPVLLEQRHAAQQQLGKHIRANLRELDRQLGEHQACTRLNADGGWYAVVRVPATVDDEELALELLQECGVFVHPGHFYSFPGDGYLVVSLITRPEIFRAGMERLLGNLARR
jgi:alanine-synthesizing transaminase